ncbi:MAG: hypothetical protein EXR71_08530 [Myxococcales bacterium]|nr:hypothetical protein [Myxococcales bacterium]
MGCLLAIALAFSAPMELFPSPGARVDVLPAVIDGRTELILHGNTVDLHEQVGWTVGTGVRRARAVDLAGDWLISLEMDDSATTVRLEPAASGWRLVVVPRERFQDPLFGPTGLDAALAGTVDSRPCAPMPLAVRPLVGRDARWFALAVSRTPRMPVWSVGEPAVVSWADVDDTRGLLAQHDADRPRLLYRLGALTRDLGHHREAAYYFTRAAEAGAPSPARFQAARSQLAVQNWSEAEASARAGAKAGGARELALQVVGIREWATGGDESAGYGRALAAVAMDPEAQILAGALLAGGGCVAEGRDVFVRAIAETDGAVRETAWMLLAESALARGDLISASRALTSVQGTYLDLDARRVLRGRTRLLAILGATPAAWTSFLPGVTADAQLPGEAGAESLYVLAQLQAHLGDDRAALRTFAELTRRYPRLEKGQVSFEFARAWRARVEQALDQGRPMDALALHRAAWSPAMAHHVTDPAPLRRIASAYAAVGLRESAVTVWKDVADLERVQGVDGRESVRQLAWLYLATGHDEDALDAVEWLRRQRAAPEDSAEYAMIEGVAAHHAGRGPQARRAWELAAASPRFAARAGLRLALLDASDGHCPQAIAPLELAAAGPPGDDVDHGLVREALLKCLLAVGRVPDAAQQAVLTAGLSIGDDVRGWSTWRAARLDGAAGGPSRPLLADAARGSSGVWGALAREEAAHLEFSKHASNRGFP